MSKLSRQRGQTYEREICKEFKDKTPYKEVKRHLEFQKEEAREGRDLDNTGVFAVQCKRGRKYANPNKIEEVNRPDLIPLLITRADNKHSIACLYLDDLFDLLYNWRSAPSESKPDFLN